MNNFEAALENDFTRKFKSLEELMGIVELLRKEKIIVAKNGSYDILHPGHIRALYESRAQGDILVVGLDSDDSIRKRKGKERPICSETDRAEVLAAVKCVDYITLIDDSVEFVKAIKPDVYTNGPEWGANCKEAEHIKRNGGRVHIYQRYEEFSTTKIIEKIRGIKCL